jgi:hypothetical protein
LLHGIDENPVVSTPEPGMTDIAKVKNKPANRPIVTVAATRLVLRNVASITSASLAGGFRTPLVARTAVPYMKFKRRIGRRSIVDRRKNMCVRLGCQA